MGKFGVAQHLNREAEIARHSSVFPPRQSVVQIFPIISLSIFYTDINSNFEIMHYKYDIALIIFFCLVCQLYPKCRVDLDICHKSMNMSINDTLLLSYFAISSYFSLLSYLEIKAPLAHHFNCSWESTQFCYICYWLSFLLMFL